MIPAEAIPLHAQASLPLHRPGAPHWEARLSLEYERRSERTVLARRSHSGPLRVQRDLYPEGSGTCHTIVVHPPGGIAGGDSLRIAAKLGEGSAALLTTPGAGKWYRTNASAASQSLEFTVAAGASLEWLPQETILFDGAVAQMRTSVNLSGDAVYLGWEVLCFGRAASGQRFESGLLSQRTTVLADEKCLWSEQARVAGNDPLFASPVGLDGHSVCATLIVAGRDIPSDAIATCREVTAGENAISGVTRLPRLLIARWLGDSSEDARRYFVALWKVLRPVTRKTAAVEPRIWST
jgi:urease accessory protein